MDYYSILGVERTATQDEIKTSYRKLVMIHHPDKGGDKAKFQEINNAYEILGNSEKRAAHDNPAPNGFNFSHNGFNPGGFHFTQNSDSGIDLNDILSKVFAQRGGYNPFEEVNSSTGRTKQKSIHRSTLNVTLIDAFSGLEQTLQVSTLTGTKAITIKIPAGIQTGDRIKYDDVLDDGVLVITFNVLNDLKFDRNGDDLHSNLSISVLDLIVGTQIKFTTISGKALDITINPGTQPFQNIRIIGHGMPNGNGQRGDQILLLKPFIPSKIEDTIIEAIKNSTQKDKK